MKNKEYIDDEKLDTVVGGISNETTDGSDEENEKNLVNAVSEVRRREHYDKPVVKRKKKAEIARKRKY